MRGPIKQAYVRRSLLHDKNQNQIRFRALAEQIVAPRTAKVPPPPAALNAKAHEEWKRTAKSLWEAGLLPKLDLPVLESYCTLWLVLQESNAAVKKYGYYSKEGKMMPAAKATISVARQMQHLLEQLGMTAVSRARLAGRVTPEKAEDPLETFLRNGEVNGSDEQNA